MQDKYRWWVLYEVRYDTPTGTHGLLFEGGLSQAAKYKVEHATEWTAGGGGGQRGEERLARG